MPNTTQGLVLDPFILSEQQLLDIYHNAVRKIQEITHIMEFEGQGSHYKQEMLIPLVQAASEARYALKQKNPSKYGNITTQVMPFFV